MKINQIISITIASFAQSKSINHQQWRNDLQPTNDYSNWAIYGYGYLGAQDFWTAQFFVARLNNIRYVWRKLRVSYLSGVLLNLFIFSMFFVIRGESSSWSLSAFAEFLKQAGLLNIFLRGFMKTQPCLINFCISSYHRTNSVLESLRESGI